MSFRYDLFYQKIIRTDIMLSSLTQNAQRVKFK